MPEGILRGAAALLPLFRPEARRDAAFSGIARESGAAHSLEKLDPSFDLKRVKAIVFDVDGTLYSLSRGRYVQRYLEMAKERMSPANFSAFTAEWNKALAGKSPFVSGRVYDGARSKILVTDREGKATEAYETWGARLSPAETRKLYPAPIDLKNPDYLSMEGGTWVLTGIARSFGIDAKTDDAMRQIGYKEVAANPGDFFKYNPKLSKFFSDLKSRNYKIAVMTDTLGQFAEPLLKTLGVPRSTIDAFIPDANKPFSSAANLTKIADDFGLKPADFLSVGDSVGKDLDVPRALGMQTLFVEDFPVQTMTGVGAKGKSIDSVIDAFNALWEKEGQAKALQALSA